MHNLIIRGSAVAAVVCAAVLSPPASAQNAIVLENTLPGNPPAEWEVSGAGDDTIQGFATDISVDQGETIEFKVRTDSSDYRIDIYRLGYYGGLGARLVATVEPSATLPQIQPPCAFDAGLRLLDCGNWGVSASWPVPVDATSGIYLARLVREDPPNAGAASHVVFVVRDDDGGSEVLFQTSDTTWQAYNLYAESDVCGGNSLYAGPGGKASAVSYNRPYSVRGCVTEDWVFNAEYPMVRWLERNGFDVSYFTGIDSDRRGAEILEHQVFLSVGHDEYWSADQRLNVTDARDAGVHLGFFSGNECYWKVRWADSIAGATTPHRTMVCYKEGTLGENNCGGKCDPLPDVWTGLWRDGCVFTPPADGCEPENELSGQISWIGSTASITVPWIYGYLPFWRNTAVADLMMGGENDTATLGAGTLGYEWDPYQPAYDASAPPGLLWLSSTTVGADTHHLSIYEASSGALVFGAGTVQWSWGLDDIHDRGSAPPDLSMQQATVNLLSDMGVQPETLQVDLVPGSPPGPDVDAPVVIARAPAVDANNVPISALVTATFDEPVVAGSINLELRDSGLGLVPATIAYSSVTRTATLTPDDWLAYGETYTATVSGVEDPAGNPMPTPDEWSFTTAGPPVCPCSVWGNLAMSDVAGHGDFSANELGTRFRSDTDGYVTGVRFFKTLTNTGTHVGHLWTNGGTLLGTVTFAGETASGWQEALFAAPIAITADTTYVVSYHAPNGQYAFAAGYFAGGGVGNAPLRALGDGEDGANGVYAAGPAGTFPVSTFNSANYWVDVIFDFTAVDETPPVLIARTPAGGASGVPATTTVTATFQEPVVEATILFELRDASLSLVPATFAYDGPTRTASLTPPASLAYGAQYTASVSNAEDLAGNVMLGADEWSFTTGSPPPPPPDEGPGGPILIVADAANPFGRYFAEILRTEGFNYFNVTDISLVTPAVLADYEVVILGEMTLDAGAVTTFTDWVTAGGSLIAMRPDPQLAGLLGLTPAGGTLAEGYVLVDTAAQPGQGIVGETIQYHGSADLYTLAGATGVATLYADAATPTVNPAVTLRVVGAGSAAAFTYDLARSIVYTRQGNPAWAGQERDGTAPIRSDDQFYPDWINLDKVAIPQADEQQRLLANMILDTVGHPWPRFWYLPSFHKAAVIMTGDQHGCCGGTSARFQIYVDQSPPGCSVDDWECVRASSYVYPGGGMSDAEALAWHNLGFELGVHVNTGCGDWTPAQLDVFYMTQLATFAAQFPSLPVQDSERTHCIAWSTWAGQAAVKTLYGIRLDTNYYFWPPGWVQDRPGMFTGSGMVMRFADLDGTMFDVYQAVSQMTDESGQSFPFTIDALLDKAIGPEGYYGAFCANMHTDSAPHAGSDAIVASAQARGVPVVSGRQMLVWLDGRNASTYSGLDWSGSVLAFTVTVGSGANNLRGMIPAAAPAGVLGDLSRDGGSIAFTTETIKGVEYAIFDAQPGDYLASYLPDETPPVISGLAAIPGNDGTAQVTWSTDEVADSLVVYGTDPGDLSSSVSSALLVTSHELTVIGLAPDTTYYYRATSADAAANAATEPPLPGAPASFATPGPVCGGDTLAADFQAGAPTGTYVAETGDGEVILAPAVGAEFFGAALPAGWETVPWAGGGGAIVGGGAVAVDGARVNTTALFAPDRSIEFVATFNAAANQHVGFAVDFDAPPWAMFSTQGTTDTLFARSASPGFINTNLGAGYVGAPHRYRIDWNPASIDFFIDGVPVATHSVTIATNMRPIASDLVVGGPAVSVDWMRMTPYDAAGSFESRVFDAGTDVAWGAMNWVFDDGGTGHLDMFARIGPTPVPDGSWTPYVAVPSSGSVIGGSSRYLQYRADMDTTDTGSTPELAEVQLSCSAGPDVTAPLVLAVTPLDGAAGVAVDTAVTAVFNEPMSAATIDVTSFTLTPSGGGGPVSAAVSYQAGTLTATLMPDADLVEGELYETRLTTAVEDAAGNPLAADSVWSFATVAPDLTPPMVVIRVPSPGAAGVTIDAVVTATFSEPMNPSTINGTTFTLTPAGGGAAVAAAVSYDVPSMTATLDPAADLDFSTDYDARVTTGAEDLAGNPQTADDVWTFTIQAMACLVDDLTGDFDAGTTGPDTYVSETDDGEVILLPQEGAEFGGTALPPGWISYNWAGGASIVVAGGEVTLDGARINPAAFYGPPRRLEFVATFQAVPHQHVGFGAGNDAPPDEIFNTFPFLIFSTGTAGTAVLARVGDPGGGITDLPLTGGLLGAPHLYRIDWNEFSVDFFVDGALEQSVAIAIPDDMRPAASDLTVGGAVLAVDWMRMTPYAPSGSFESRIYDAGATAAWDLASWNDSEPAGTVLSIFVRTGDVAVPDGTWSPYTLVPASGGVVGGSSRYIQYRADLATADLNVTPALADIAVGCTAGPDLFPPTISNIVAVPGVDGMTAIITWDTDEPADSLVVLGTDPGSLPFGGGDAALLLAHEIDLSGLTPDTTYYYRVSSADAAANSATAPEPPADPLSFTTPPAVCMIDDLTTDFGAGSFGAGTWLAETVDGEVGLAPTAGSEFFGNTLPAGWEIVPWGVGNVTVGGGALSVDGARVNTTALYPPGRSIEFVATFGAAAFQHVGFAVDFSAAAWAMFSTNSTSTTLFARTASPGQLDTNLGTGYVGAPHRYRIDWNPSSIDFFIDGGLVATHNVAIATDMRPIVSDFNDGAPAVSVDWIRMTPYAAAGTFESRIVDAGTSVGWVQATWTAAEPAGTSLDIAVRTGQTPVPDGSWTAYASIAASGGTIGQTGRYLQYRAELASGDDAATAVLEDIEMTCGGPNLSPVAGDDADAVVQGDPVLIDVLANDTDDDGTLDPATVTIVVPPAFGFITDINPVTGGITYEHDGTPVGADSFEYTVRDDFGATSNQAVVTLNVVNEVVLDIALGGVNESTVSRCIEFELFDCAGGSAVVAQDLEFALGQAAGVRIEVPLADYDCMTAVDPYHTLVRVDDTFGSIDGIHYTADFTDHSGGGGANRSLIGGNANGDRYVDIIDYGMFTGQWNQVLGVSACGSNPPHTDFSGDGIVFLEDFTFITTNFLRESDGPCCPITAIADGPLVAISVAELARRGLDELAVADLNDDGWVDVLDIVAFMGGDRPDPLPPGRFRRRPAVAAIDGASWFENRCWQDGAPPGSGRDVILPMAIVIDGGAAVALDVRVTGELRIGRGSLSARTLTIESGGTLRLSDAGALVTVHTLSLQHGAILLWQDGVLEVAGGVYSQARPDLLIGGGSGDPVLRLVAGATAQIERDTVIGGGPGAGGELDVVAATFSTGRSLIVGGSGAGWLAIDAGGSVLSRDGVVGDRPASEGGVQVSGPGSQWTVDDAVDVGFGGSGTLWLNGGGAIAATQIRIGPNGLLTGDGAVSAAVANDGVLRPGRLVIDGEMTQGPDGVMVFGDGDRLDVTGNVFLAGELVLNVTETPPAGTMLRIVTAHEVFGRFDRLDLPALPPGLRWAVRYGSGGVTLAVVAAAPGIQVEPG